MERARGRGRAREKERGRALDRDGYHFRGVTKMVEGAGAAEAAGAHGWTARGRGRYAGVVIWYAEGRFVPAGWAFGTPGKNIFRS